MTDTPSKTRLSDADNKALVQLADLLKVSGAEWATEQQWRTWADRLALKPSNPQQEDIRARGFRIVDLTEAGKIESAQAVFHVMRQGATAPTPVSIYRPL